MEHAVRELALSLTAAGYEKRNITNFLALRPVGLRAHFAHFSKLLRTLDGLVAFLIILSISAPRPICLVEATSAWDSPGCFIQDDVQPTVQESVRLIATVDRPRSRFALTLSLRTDVFENVDYSLRPHQGGLPRNSAAGKTCYSRRHHFVRRGECPLAEAPRSAAHSADSSGDCNFVVTTWQSERRVMSFETAASMERTMLRAYRSLGPSKHGILSWLLYNVTSYAAVRFCPMGHTRIDKVREVLDRYRQPKLTF
ncbi:uncharacterized protein LOC144109620 [Amblyomma americanum]